MELPLKFLTLALAITVSLQRTIRHDSELKTDGSSQNTYDNFPGLPRSDDLANCSCDSRYVAHYEAKGCRPAQRNFCGCPVKFQCPSANEIEEDAKACHYKGKTFLPGEPIDTNNPCQRCRCSVGPSSGIICTLVECPATTGPPRENCHHIYEVGQCCPIKTVCFGDGNDTSDTEKSNATCEYNDRVYPLGSRMYSKEDPCEVCLCTEEWINTNGTDTNCYQTNCILEKYKSKLLKGCVPVYQEDTCCPVDFYCAPGDEFLHDNKTVDTVLAEEDLQCAFFGKHYKIGDTVSISGDTDCLSCVCQVPPDITCMQHTCAPNPKEGDCYPYYTSGGGCCPKYECLLSDGEAETSDEDTGNAGNSGRSEVFAKREMEDEGPVVYREGSESGCLETLCSEDMVCMLYKVDCANGTCLPVPTCLRTNMSCPTPFCPTGCVVIEQDCNHCPTCVCGEEVSKYAGPLKCSRPRCFGRNCILVAGEDGCPTCSCSEPCTACPPGCNVLTDLESTCPRCVCENERAEEGCPTPVCANDRCRIENLPNGCPTCVCEDASVAGNDQAMSESQVQPVLQQQQQQQQQQQLDHENVERELRHSMENSEASDDYDDTIVLMSGGSLGRSSNLEERSSDFNERSRENDETHKSKIFEKAREPSSNIIQIVAMNSQSRPFKAKKDI